MNFIIFILLYLAAFEECIYSSIFKVKYKFELSKAYEANSQFDAAYRTDTTINISMIKCLSQCLSKSNCISAVFAKYNDTLTLCSTYSSSPALGINLILTNNSIISQKVFTKSTSKLIILINLNNTHLIIFKLLFRTHFYTNRTWICRRKKAYFDRS